MERISFEKLTLSNGLDVILHQDRSLPLVSVNVWYHVGYIQLRGRGKCIEPDARDVCCHELWEPFPRCGQRWRRVHIRNPFLVN